MLGQITISAKNVEGFRPLLQSALERQAQLLNFSIQRTLDELKVYEDRYQMSSAEFERQFKAREIEESLDYLDWWMEIEALHHLEENRQILEDARVE